MDRPETERFFNMLSGQPGRRWKFRYGDMRAMSGSLYAALRLDGIGVLEILGTAEDDSLISMAGWMPSGSLPPESVFSGFILSDALAAVNVLASGDEEDGRRIGIAYSRFYERGTTLLVRVYGDGALTPAEKRFVSFLAGARGHTGHSASKGKFRFVKGGAGRRP